MDNTKQLIIQYLDLYGSITLDLKCCIYILRQCTLYMNVYAYYYTGYIDVLHIICEYILEHVQVFCIE